MTLPFVPTDSGNEKQHRTVLATTINELVKVRPPHDQTEAEVAAGVRPVNQSYPEGHPARYGIVGDGVTVNDFSPMEALHLQGVPFILPAGQVGYVTQDTVTLAGIANVQMLSPIICDFSSVQTGVVVGTSANSNARSLHHIIRVRRSDYDDWTDTDDIGVLFHNCFANHVDLREVSGWRTGVEFRATGGLGFSHNNIFIENTNQNLVHIRLCTVTSGFCNENTFIGGRFSNFGSGLPDNADKTGRRAVVIDSRDDSYVINNNNIFIRPCFQVEGGVGIEIADGTMNRVIAARSEMGSGSYAALFSGDSAYNWVDVEYATTGDSERVRYESTANASNVVYLGRYKDLRLAQRVLFAKDSLIEHYSPYNADTTAVIGMSFKRLAGGASNSFVRNGGNITGSEPVEANYTSGTVDLAGWAIGVRVETHTVKSFVLEVDTDSTSDHTFLVQCFDSSGTRLDATSSPGPYVVGSGRTNETFSTTAQGAYRTANTAGARVSFRVSDSVAWIWVGVGRSTSATAKIRAFRVMTGEFGPAPVSPGHSSSVVERLISTSSPETLSRGTWVDGDVVWNADAAAGERAAWMCVTSGTPGTWLPFGPIQLGQTYTVTNASVDRSFDADTATAAELADVLGTLIADFKSAGLLP